MPQRGGPAVLRAGDEGDVRLPADLRAALREWSEVADRVLQAGDAHEVDLLRRRARQLAVRAAAALGRPVEFVDPVSGAVELIVTGSMAARVNGMSANGAVRRAAAGGAARDGSASDGSASDGVGRHGAVAGRAVVDGSASDGSAANGVTSNGAVVRRRPEGGPRPRPVLAPEPPGPTPWGTGVAVAVFFAVLVAFADTVLVTAFAGAFGLLWVPANLLVTAGTLPSLWLAREVPFWRWPAFGAAAGLAAAWVVMLLGLLAP